jgi:pimeloyl-ACP methyl ester carboxylesterase
MYKSLASYEKMRDFYEDGLAKYKVPYVSQYVDTRYGATHMLAMGPTDAPPLVLLQGLAGSAILWHQQVEAFSRHFRLYALDTVGQPGRSAPNAPSIFGTGYVDWLIDVLDGLTLQKAHMLGVSLGSWAIIELGMSHPARLDKAVLLSPMGLARGKMNVRRWIPNPTRRNQADADDDALTAQLQERSFSPTDAGGQREKFDRQLARAMALATRHYRVDLAMGLKDDEGRIGKAIMMARTMLKFMAPTPDHRLRQFRSDGMLIIGEHDSLYEAHKAAARARALMPQLRIEIIEGAGHAAIYERPEYVSQLIIDYLR